MKMIKKYEKIMQNMQSEGIYGFSDDNKDRFIFDKTYVLTDEDNYKIDKLNE